MNAPVPRSLVLATDIDVLPAGRVVERHGDHLVIRSPANPAHWMGNQLIFDDAPGPGDGPRWEARFVQTFPDARHRVFSWDRGDGEEGAAQAEFGARGYDIERSVGLTAAPQEIRAHPRANREVEIRTLDPAPGADAALWDGVIAVQLATNDEEREPIEDFEPFARRRQEELRVLFRAGRGAWYVALDPASRKLVGSCGVVATGPRGRFQTVDTLASHRRRGICRRLVAEAAAHAAARHGLRTLVIAAERDYHALGIYESLGFVARERTCAVLRPPGRR